MEELIGVGLHMSALIFGVPGALYVGLGTVTDQVVLLAILNVLVQALVVLSTAGLVTVIRYRKQRIQCVRTHAALHTTAHAVADQTGHQLLFQQIFLGVMDVSGAVDGISCDVGSGRADIDVVGIICRIVALLHNVSTAHDPVGQVALGALFPVGTVQLLAMQVDVGLHCQQAGFIRLVGANTIFCHFIFLHKFSTPAYLAITGTLNRSSAASVYIFPISLYICNTKNGPAKNFAFFRGFTPHVAF